ncbi:MAG: hypothetical protein U9R79_00390 [Armatimonadota bacterium]|nr:hypothetical protein [Armatimonadota bacterium]
MMVLAIAALMVVPATADELADAMARADALNFFNSIGLEESQAQRMIAPVQRIRDLVQQHEQTSHQRLQAMTGTLQQARALLLAGQELPEGMRLAIANYREHREQARLTLMRAVDQEMSLIEDILYPDQNAMLDWTPPDSVRPKESVQQILEQQQIAMGRIQRAAQMLDRVKHLDPFNFVTARTPIVNDFLAMYFEPGTRRWERARRAAIDATDQARMLTEDQWQANALDVARDLIDRLGLMPTFEPERRPGAISWDALYRLFTSPATLEVLKELPDAR